MSSSTSSGPAALPRSASERAFEFTKSVPPWLREVPIAAAREIASNGAQYRLRRVDLDRDADRAALDALTERVSALSDATEASLAELVTVTQVAELTAEITRLRELVHERLPEPEPINPRRSWFPWRR